MARGISVKLQIALAALVGVKVAVGGFKLADSLKANPCGKVVFDDGFHWFVGLGLRLIYALFRLNPHVVHNKIANIAFFSPLPFFALCALYSA